MKKQEPDQEDRGERQGGVRYRMRRAEKNERQGRKNSLICSHMPLVRHKQA